ncbi:rRNA maturation RNase YbeY [Eremococcus coleocola]|uniref:Endoribonuclease YbeY n=1 Tax=Eremococcus coleocola ACS-139-V-Col8 TaxID=908337 RepID=E4KM29_9LACT|nr:rRNA maturation RNase YbeY [Eremococcus coleocola]EFR32062.1 translation metalloprotein YbeY [Eremococcus coleocola ACS-139-V-Col8]
MVIDVIDDNNFLSQAQVELVQDVIKLAGQKLILPDNFEVDISIVTNEAIHELNRDYRNIDRPTDVLSFALEETAEDDPFGQIDMSEELGIFLGDIIISFPKIQEQATEYGHSFERELAFLAVHGFLHLNGYDHQSPDQEKEMFGLQEEVLSAYGLER